MHPIEQGGGRFASTGRRLGILSALALASALPCSAAIDESLFQTIEKAYQENQSALAGFSAHAVIDGTFYHIKENLPSDAQGASVSINGQACVEEKNLSGVDILWTRAAAKSRIDLKTIKRTFGGVSSSAQNRNQSSIVMGGTVYEYDRSGGYGSGRNGLWIKDLKKESGSVEYSMREPLIFDSVVVSPSMAPAPYLKERLLGQKLHPEAFTTEFGMNPDGDIEFRQTEKNSLFSAVFGHKNHFLMNKLEYATTIGNKDLPLNAIPKERAEIEWAEYQSGGKTVFFPKSIVVTNGGFPPGTFTQKWAFEDVHINPEIDSAKFALADFKMAGDTWVMNTVEKKYQTLAFAGLDMKIQP